MRFCILGPLRVTDAGRELSITAGRDRTVLAMLLLSPGRIVGADDLIDAVWEERPPATARGQLQTCVSRLRRMLPAGTILTDPAGYGIAATDDDLDALAFTHLVAQAKVAPAEARTLLHQALSLWRGAALAGIESRSVRHRAAVLDEQRAVAIEDRVDLELADGQDRDLVAELTGLVEGFPLRERLRSQLMLALYRSGRQADALAEYRRARDLLQDQVGVEPGPALQDLHRQLLLGGAELPSPPAAFSRVDMLPRAVGDFTGREAPVARLLAAVDSGAAHPQVLAVDGMAGSGKTTIAVHVAGLVRDSFPDAQLFIDLHGHSEDRPVSPEAALATLLRQLDVPANRIPDDPGERLRLWRSELAARRALVVLDNAASTAQVTGLLPATGRVLVLVTSRRRLTGLDAVRPESLGVLTEADAVALLARIVGERAGAEPAAAIEVVRRCGCLPLAIRLAGARLAHRPAWRIADLARRLAESALPELAVEDRTVASALALSYGQLSTPAQRLFRLLALHPAERFGALAAAALGGLSLEETRAVLDELVDVHLAEEPETEQYRLHDLVREYAGTLAAELGADDRAAALTGLVDLHLHASARLNRPQEGPGARRDHPAGAPLRPDLVTLAVAQPGWLDRQRADLVALVRAARDVGDHRRAWQLARVNWAYLYLRADIDDLITLLSLGRTVAQEGGEDLGAAAVGGYLASGYYRAGRHDEALRLLTDVLQYERRSGDAAGMARCHMNRGGVLLRTGRLEEALAEMELARKISIISVRGGALRARVNIATAKFALGRHAEAMYEARIGLQDAVEHRDDRRVCNALTLLAQIRLASGDLAVATSMLRAGLRIAVALGHRVGEWECHHGLGRIALAEGRYPASVDHHLTALRLMREHGDAADMSGASNDLAATLLAMGDPRGAGELYRHALDLARRSQARYEQGRALAGLGSCVVGDDPAQAAVRWRQALEIFTRMGVPERSAVQRRLTGLEPPVGAETAVDVLAC